MTELRQRASNLRQKKNLNQCQVNHNPQNIALWKHNPDRRTHNFMISPEENVIMAKVKQTRHLCIRYDLNQDLGLLSPIFQTLFEQTVPFLSPFHSIFVFALT